ncbi:serine hydrolase domain-containing protein [Halopseudomonas pertucinogena]|uniref:serine hydrolase domain-containing protein n=1 Tax=Halopseudomonas pertucinogena TaxID=86175 RepID=UPI00166C7F28|nr:serine hydrolase domain-containing protein [Halopseudomonas pertucinogena]
MRHIIRLFAAIVVGSSLLGVPSYFWIGDRPKVLRALYPLSAALSAPTLSCSPSAPDWMGSVSKFSLWNNASPAGQLAHISADGDGHECYYGWSGVPLMSLPVNSRTRFRYASMTKLLTADLVLRDVQAGRLALDDVVFDQLDVAAEPLDERLSQLTVGHLLRHSAGFDRLKTADSMVVRDRKPWCPYTADPLSTVRLDFTPGSRYAYSNLNYCLLGMLLEQSTPEFRDFRALMEQEYDLAARGIRFIDGPYLDDEVIYDFRHSGFYGEDYWRYFDFKALSSSAGLSGSAMALAELLSSLRTNGRFAVTQAPAEDICRENVFRGCYGYSVFSYQPSAERLRIHVQPGLLYGAPSLAILDDEGGVTVWVGNGTRASGSSTDAMLEQLYAALDAHYSGAASH